MLDAAINKVVRLTIPTTAKQFERVLGSLPRGVRFGAARELNKTGEARRYNIALHCVYYLRLQGPGIMVWRWNYVASRWEANRIQALITSLEGTLDAYRASQIFEHATHRSVNNPRPIGMPPHALDFSDYPMLLKAKPAGAPAAVAAVKIRSQSRQRDPALRARNRVRGSIGGRPRSDDDAGYQEREWTKAGGSHVYR